MSIALAPLPYALDALAPHISAETLEYHYGKHHKAYVDKLNTLIPGTPAEHMGLEEMILKTDGPIFNNAAQVWNHSFYWDCLSPLGGGEPSDELAAAIMRDFGDFARFKELFTQAAIGRFGSGWAWLVKKQDGHLEILSTGNADNPLRDGKKPLLTCDVWEHAYYIDTRNDRAKYVQNFWQLVNWDFVAANLNP